MSDAQVRKLMEEMQKHELSESELRELRRVIAFGLDGSEEVEAVILVAFDKDPSVGGAANSWPRVPWHLLQFLGDEGGFRSARRRLNDADSAPRLLHLLETTGLATPPDHPGWIGISPLRVGVERKTLERLDRLARS